MLKIKKKIYICIGMFDNDKNIAHLTQYQLNRCVYEPTLSIIVFSRMSFLFYLHNAPTL